MVKLVTKGVLIPQAVADGQNSTWPSAGSLVVQLIVAVDEEIPVTDLADIVGAVVSFTTLIGADSSLLFPALSRACKP